MGIELKAYAPLKTKGLVSVQKVGEKAITALVAMPTFDHMTGEQNGVASDQFNLQGIDESIAKARADKTAAIAAYDDYLATLATLRADVAAALA